MFPEIGQSLVARGNCRRIDHQRAFRVQTVVRDEGRILIKVDVHSLADERTGEVAGRAVIASHPLPQGEEIALKSSHADAARAHKV